MTTVSHSPTISRKVSSFLDGKVHICSPAYPYLRKSIVIRDLVHAILSGIEASPEIQEACTSIEAVFTGSYLANKVTSLHSVVNDRDLKIYFRLKDPKMQFALYHKVRMIAAKYLMDQLTDVPSLDPTSSLLAIGAKKDHSTIVKNLRLGFLELEGGPHDLPLEISMIFADKPYLTHLASIDSLEVPLKVCGKDLGSEQTPGEFIIRSKEGENIEEILSQLAQKKITSSKSDWDPKLVNYFELGRYFIWICEQCTEIGSTVFSCFYEGSIEKNSPKDLWRNLYSFVQGKRSAFAQYPFFLFCNFLFHSPRIEASSWLLEMQEELDHLLYQMPCAPFLKRLLYTPENKLKPNALFLLSCHLPFLAEKVECVDHLGRRQLQCYFSEQGKSFTVLIPIPSLEEDLDSWLRELLLTNSSKERLWQIFSFALSPNIMGLQRQDPISLWRRYKTTLGDEQKVQDLMQDLFISENERFFEILSLDGSPDIVYGTLKNVFPRLNEVSEVFQEKYKSFPKSKKMICQWLLSLAKGEEDRFFEALSFILAILPQDRVENFISNTLLTKLLAEQSVYSSTFVERYKKLMGHDGEIQAFLHSLLPSQEDQFIEVLSFVCSDLPIERQRLFTYELLEKIIADLKESPSLWMRYKMFLGEERDLQDYLYDLFLKEDEKFFEILSLDRGTSFVYETLQRVFPHLEKVSESFQQKYKSIFKREKMLCTWMVSLLDRGADHFFDALLFVLATLPPEKAKNFVRNTLFIELLDKEHILSSDFLEKYKRYMGSEEEIQDLVLSFLPLQQDRFFQALSFFLKGLSTERQKSIACHIVEIAIPFIDKTSSLWEKCKNLLGNDLEIQDWMLRLFTENERLFIQALSLEKNSAFVCEIFREVLFQVGSVSESFLVGLEPILQQHVIAAKPWKGISIRCIMESLLPSKYLRILARKSGIVQNGKVVVQGSQFPKLFPTKEKERVFALKIALLFMDSSYVVDNLKDEVSEEGIAEVKASFSEASALHPIFKDLIDKELIHEASMFLECQKKIWGITQVLPWYEQLFQRTNFPHTEDLCKKSAQEALRLSGNPWSCYATFSSMPSVLPLIEPYLVIDPIDLPNEEKASCLRALLVRISHLIESSDIATASRLVSYMPYLHPTEKQIAPVLATLFEKSSKLEDRQMIARLMYELAPSFTKSLIEYFKRPYSFKKEQMPVSSNFPINQWIIAFLHQVQDPLYFSLLIEQLEKLISISSSEVLTIIQKYAPRISEEEREKLALAAIQLPVLRKSIGQEIFVNIAPSCWSRMAPLPKIWNFIKEEPFLVERRSQLIEAALARIPNYLAEAPFFAEIIAHMGFESKRRFFEKSYAEIRSAIEEWRQFLQGITKNKVRPSLSSMAEEPFVAMICQSLPLYEMLVSIFHVHMANFTTKENQAIFRLLEQAPEGLSQEMQGKRLEIFFHCMKKLKSVSVPSWLAKDVAEDVSLQEEFQKMCLLQPNASSLFLQEIAFQLEVTPKDPTFYRFLHQQISSAHFADVKTLESLIVWLKKQESLLMNEDLFQIGRELLFLSIRSKKNFLAEDVLVCLYQNLGEGLRLDAFQDRVLTLTSDLCKQHPSFLKSEHIQKMAQWISHQSTVIDDPKVIEATNQLLAICRQMKSVQPDIFPHCLMYLLPSFDATSDSLSKVALLYKNYLSVIRKLPSKDLKGMDLRLLEPLQPYLLAMQSRFTDGCFASASADILTLYMKAGQLDQARAWADQWMSQQEPFLDDIEAFKKFHSHHWMFLRFLAREYSSFIEKSSLLRSINYIQSMQHLLDSSLISEYKTDSISMCSSINQPELTKKILSLFCPSLDSAHDNEQNLRQLFADYISLLMVTHNEKNIVLGEEFFEPIMTYLLAMKERMPLMEELYVCLQGMSILSKCHGYKIGDVLEALCPPLDPDSQNLDEICLLHTYYMPILLVVARDCEFNIRREKLASLVQYVIRMQEKGGFSDIDKLSRNLLAVCAECGRVDLVTALMENVHKKRMLQFYQEKKSIDISEDLGCYLNYLIIPKESSKNRIFSAEEFIQILKEHKTRIPSQGLPSYDAIMDVFMKEVRKIHEGGRSNPALFHVISMVAVYLLENEPISARVTELIHYAYHCPWADFCFHTFLNLHHIFHLKMEQQGITDETLPGAFYAIPFNLTMSRVCENFLSSNFAVGSESLGLTVRDFMMFFYTLYKESVDSAQSTFFKRILVQGVEKIAKERPSWMFPAVSTIFMKYPGCMPDFQSFIREANLSSEKRISILASIAYVNMFSAQRQLYAQGEKFN